jgi:hypothetical protein
MRNEDTTEQHTSQDDVEGEIRKVQILAKDPVERRRRAGTYRRARAGLYWDAQKRRVRCKWVKVQ